MCVSMRDAHMIDLFGNRFVCSAYCRYGEEVLGGKKAALQCGAGMETGIGHVPAAQVKDDLLSLAGQCLLCELIFLSERILFF